MNMQTKVQVKLQVNKSFLYFLSELAGMCEDEVACTLYDLADEPLKKVLSEDFQNHWSQKKVRFPKTKLDLSIKVKFVHFYNKKAGDVYITVTLPTTKMMTFTEQQISTMAVEKFLLNAYDGDKNASST